MPSPSGQTEISPPAPALNSALTPPSACPEWEDPQGSSYPIPIERVLHAVGYREPSIRAVQEHLHEQANLRAVLGV